MSFHTLLVTKMMIDDDEYAKCFDETKYISFWIKDDQLLKNIIKS